MFALFVSINHFSGLQPAIFASVSISDGLRGFCSLPTDSSMAGSAIATPLGSTGAPVWYSSRWGRVAYPG